MDTSGSFRNRTVANPRVGRTDGWSPIGIRTVSEDRIPPTGWLTDTNRRDEVLKYHSTNYVIDRASMCPTTWTEGSFNARNISR